MIISDENNILMFAILSMDVYNRDSNNTPAVIYGALNASAGSANGPVSLGNARLISTSYNDTTLFGAASYNVSGQIVVAYRGTVFDSFWHEAWNGYGVGAGSPTGPQAQEAITFYQKVANSLPNFNGNYATANIMLTGHSLGGGLAGFIGALYGQQGVLFDNMPFEKAASNAFAYSVGFPIDPTLGLPGGAEPDAALAKEIYGSTSPYPDNIKNLITYATTGELLGMLDLRDLQNTPQLPVDPHGSPSDVPVIRETDLHSQALLVSLLWAQDNGHTLWTSLGTSLLQALFGSEGQSVKNALGQRNDPSVLLTEIAYSALGTASPGGNDPFGTTALSSLFTDADLLGQMHSGGQFTGVMGTGPAGQNAPKSTTSALAEIAVQYAGDQAAYSGQNAELR